MDVIQLPSSAIKVKQQHGQHGTFPEVRDAFVSIMDTPFQQYDVTSSVFTLIERFTCVLYDKTSGHDHVNEQRQEQFAKTQSMDNIPPTQVSFHMLLQHVTYTYNDLQIRLLTIYNYESSHFFVNMYALYLCRFRQHWSSTLNDVYTKVASGASA